MFADVGEIVKMRSSTLPLFLLQSLLLQPVSSFIHFSPKGWRAKSYNHALCKEKKVK